MNCPRCGTPMQGGICPNCGFPVNRLHKQKRNRIKIGCIKGGIVRYPR